MLVVIVLALALGLVACKKDEETTGPGPGPSPVQKGSGTVGFTYNTGSGNQTVNITGNGQWPPTGQGVASAMSSDGKRLDLVAYNQTSSKISQTAGARFTFLYIRLSSSSPIGTGLYTGEGEAAIGIDIDTAAVDSLAYFPSPGASSLTIDSISSSRFVARFSGTFIRPSDGHTMTVTNGSIAVNLGSGLFLGEDDGGGNGGGTASGSLAFNSDRGNFSASGSWNPAATSGEIVGAWRISQSGYDYLYIWGWKITTMNDIAISTVLLYKSGSLTTGNYTFPSEAIFTYTPHLNYADTSSASNSYSLINGTLNLSALTSSTAQGSFSGTGIHVTNNTTTINVSNGSFDVTYETGPPGGKNAPVFVRDYLEKILQESISKR
jgi:hypothetical protein